MDALPARAELLEVPIVDLSPVRDGTPDQRAAAAAVLDRAARTTGVLQVVGHRVPPAVQRGLTEAIDGFFGLPMWQKKALRPAATELNRGYTPPRSERLSLNRAAGAPAGSAPGELFEAFHVGRSAEDFPGLGLDEIHYPPNLWPLRPASFETGVQVWFEQAARVAREVTALMAVALGLPQGYFAPYQTHSLDWLRLTNYRAPAAPTRLEPGQVGMAAHTDHGILTVLWADPIPGLQVRARDRADGGWRDVVPTEGALLVLLGDLLARWTNDRWTAAPHRVLPPTDAEGRLVRRRSAAFFHDGNADALISCLPGCSGAGDPARYESVTVSEHLAGRRRSAGRLGVEQEAEDLVPMRPRGGRVVGRLGPEPVDGLPGGQGQPLALLAAEVVAVGGDSLHGAEQRGDQGLGGVHPT